MWLSNLFKILTTPFCDIILSRLGELMRLPAAHPRSNTVDLPCDIVNVCKCCIALHIITHLHIPITRYITPCTTFNGSQIDPFYTTVSCYTHLCIPLIYIQRFCVAFCTTSITYILQHMLHYILGYVHVCITVDATCCTVFLQNNHMSYQSLPPTMIFLRKLLSRLKFIQLNFIPKISFGYARRPVGIY